jgi:hypothetical protein
MSNDETQPASGSRWEPGEAEQPPAPETPPVPAYAAPAPRPNRGRLILAGGAVGIALVAGAGGFALGHATADEGSDGGQFGQFGRFGPHGDEHGPRGFPGQGQPPGLPGDDGSGDDGSTTPDDGATQGS